MLSTINDKFNSAKKAEADDALIVESVLDVEEVIPGSEEEIDDVIDSDSVPKEVYDEIDKALDKAIGKEGYDDASAEELADEDIDEDEISDEELDAVISESAASYLAD